MLDFKKALINKTIEKAIDPIEIYKNLDRTSDKGPLRPAQIAILTNWFTSHKEEREVIIKLHTGQGKTLIGLLLLQSKLNEKKGPCLYLCPTNQLVEQTVAQAKKFGIPTCIFETSGEKNELPPDFISSNKILITSVSKLFNGLTKFGLNSDSEKVGTILMDDAHACIEIVRNAFRIKITKKDDPNVYRDLTNLFSENLKKQGIGSYADIENGVHDTFLPVPYWAWQEKEQDVARIISKNLSSKFIKFAWPLLKDYLKYCQCIVSGTSLEIEPFVPPLQMFGSYFNSTHKIFMSATISDDAFLVKGLLLSKKTINEPLTYDQEKWSGERMILLPSLIDDNLNQSKIIQLFARPNSSRSYGCVSLVGSTNKTKDWENYGALITNSETIKSAIEKLNGENYDKTIVFVNRYDGIDLPDNTCRILIFDDVPYVENLVDRYESHCRPNSEVLFKKVIRHIEQGLGRSVRGEKDFSVVILIGTSLIKLVRSPHSKKHFSSQTLKQIEIAHKITEMTRDDSSMQEDPVKGFLNIIDQCIGRDEAWKAYHNQQMDSMEDYPSSSNSLDIYSTEAKAEDYFVKNNPTKAIETIQHLLDSNSLSPEEKGWYLQQLARYKYSIDILASIRTQTSAYKNNRLLLKPENFSFEKITPISHNRIEKIMNYLREAKTFEQIIIDVRCLLDNLTMATEADDFENAFNTLGIRLGFHSERPDKEYKEGPDNLWQLDENNYIIWECKNEVKQQRVEIHKTESEQMNRSAAWFERYYQGQVNVKRILIHPSKKLESAAAFTHEVEVMTKTELDKFKTKILNFFNNFKNVNLEDLSINHIQELINANNLDTKSILTLYSIKIKQR